MGNKRRTIKIEELKDEANKVFRESLPDYTEGRRHIHTFVSKLLMDAKQYKGFRYLESRELPGGYKPGIIFDENPVTENGYKQFHHQYPDPTRISFY